MKHTLLTIFILIFALTTFVANAQISSKTEKLPTTCEYSVERWGNLEDGVIVYFNIPIKQIDSGLADKQPWYAKAKAVEGVEDMGLVGRYSLMFHKGHFANSKTVGKAIAIQVCRELGYEKIKEKRP